jgi:BirA family biotin operon repressor/biotin-[acetyl-CoA-carboxylase] ligase
MSCSYKEKIYQWDWYDADRITSTNDEIKDLATQEKNVVLSAIEQTKGRGRRGREWIGNSGNLYFSYSLKIEAQQLSQIVCLIGLSLAKTISSFSDNKQIKIKWPNDVFIENKKVSGILIENIKDNLWAIGIGVNIVSAPNLNDTNYEATSLKDNGINTNREAFLKEYLQIFQKDYEDYKKSGFNSVKKEWLRLALNYQETITIKTEKEIKKGIFLNLDDNGYLILKTNIGEEKIIAGDLFI